MEEQSGAAKTKNINTQFGITRSGIKYKPAHLRIIQHVDNKMKEIQEQIKEVRGNLKETNQQQKKAWEEVKDIS